MIRVVIDTNVPIVANGKPNPDDRRIPSLTCQLAAVEALENAIKTRCIALDLQGEIQAEYARYLSAKGQPGVGDQFYRHVINSAPGRVGRYDLPLRADGEYANLPQSLIDANFDPSDRKFAALAKLMRARVVNATDSDWLEHAGTLNFEGIIVENVCGCRHEDWFTS